MKITVKEMYLLVAAHDSVLDRLRREPLPAKLSRALFYFFAAIIDAYWICDQIIQDLEGKEPESIDNLFRQIVEVDVHPIDSNLLEGANLDIDVWSELYRFFDGGPSLKNGGSSPLNLRKYRILGLPMYSEDKFGSGPVHEAPFPHEWAKALFLPRGDLVNPGEVYDTGSGASGMMGQSGDTI